MNQKKQQCSESFKRHVVDQVNSGAMSKEEARRRYGIKSKSGILTWQRNYEKYGRCSLNLLIDTSFLKPKKSSTTNPDSSEATLLARIKQLERQLEDEQLRSEAYNKMIDIAERELNIPIRKKVQYQVIHEIKDTYARVSLVRLCRLLGLTRQAYYQHFWQQEANTIEQSLVLEQVYAIRKDHRVMGGRKLYEKLYPFLLEHQIKMGRDAFFDLLAEHKLLVKKRRRRFITTYSNHWLRKWPNLIREMEINRINQLWVSDITYWKIEERYTYISLITDAYSHKIVGYHLAQTLESVETIKALRLALTQLPNQINKPLIHHSDRGVQYCSDNYVKLLQDKGIEISMTENGDPLENAIAERINGILKSEYLKHYSPRNFQEAKEYLQVAVKLYNQDRPHFSIGLLTPDEVHSKNINVEKLWKNYFTKNVKIVNSVQDNKQHVNLG